MWPCSSRSPLRPGEREGLSGQSAFHLVVVVPAARNHLGESSGLARKIACVSGTLEPGWAGTTAPLFSALGPRGRVARGGAMIEDEREGA